MVWRQQDVLCGLIQLADAVLEHDRYEFKVFQLLDEISLALDSRFMLCQLIPHEVHHCRFLSQVDELLLHSIEVVCPLSAGPS